MSARFIYNFLVFSYCHNASRHVTTRTLTYSVSMLWFLSVAEICFADLDTFSLQHESRESLVVWRAFRIRCTEHLAPIETMPFSEWAHVQTGIQKQHVPQWSKQSTRDQHLPRFWTSDVELTSHEVVCGGWKQSLEYSQSIWKCSTSFHWQVMTKVQSLYWSQLGSFLLCSRQLHAEIADCTFQLWHIMRQRLTAMISSECACRWTLPWLQLIISNMHFLFLCYSSSVNNPGVLHWYHSQCSAWQWYVEWVSGSQH